MRFYVEINQKHTNIYELNYPVLILSLHADYLLTTLFNCVSHVTYNGTYDINDRAEVNSIAKLSVV